MAGSSDAKTPLEILFHARSPPPQHLPDGTRTFFVVLNRDAVKLHRDLVIMNVALQFVVDEEAVIET